MQDIWQNLVLKAKNEMLRSAQHDEHSRRSFVKRDNSLAIGFGRSPGSCLFFEGAGQMLLAGEIEIGSYSAFSSSRPRTLSMLRKSSLGPKGLVT